MTEKSKKALATVDQGGNLAIRFGEEEVKLIRDTKTPGASDAQFNLFLYDSQARGLNPLRNEIYWVSRQKKSKDKFGNWSSETVATHQVGIDGFRKIAQSSGEYEGQSPVEYGSLIKFAGIDVPEWAEVGVYRKGFREALKARAYFSEYAQMYNDKLGTMWEKMPRTMIAKCAEALALRKSFPAELGGLYTSDEMSQANNEASTVKEVKPTTKEQIDASTGEVKDAFEEASTPKTEVVKLEGFDEVVRLARVYCMNMEWDNAKTETFVNLVKSKSTSDAAIAKFTKDLEAKIKELNEPVEPEATVDQPATFEDAEAIFNGK